jgi:serine/threonine-protein kinase
MPTPLRSPLADAAPPSDARRFVTQDTIAADERSAPGASGVGAAGAALKARRAEAEREEHVTDVIRTRRALGLGILLWHGYLGLDAIVATWLEAPPFRFFLAERLVTTLLFLPAWLRMLVQPLPGPRLLTALDILDYSIASASVGVLSVSFGGLESPYCMGASIVLVGASMTRFYPWRTGLWRFGVPALSFIAVMVGSGLFSPLVARQLHSPQSVATFAMYLAFLATTYAFSVIGGHLVWALRRQVFETRIVGRYRLKRRLGEGGMGEVWLAYHAALRRDVAVKILRRHDWATDAAALARFEREVRATSELSHPNTVRVFDYGTTEDGLWFYAMEHLEGEDLARLVRREGPMAPARAIHVVSQAARALGEAHERGIVHRDVKPENILLTSLGGEHDFVKVVDFGIAKLAREEDGSESLTQTGAMLGTPAYMSPEAAAGKPVDARSDVYGLGVVLHFLLTGAPPFEATTLGALLHAHLQATPPPPSTRAPHPISAELDALVGRALAKAPVDRFADGAALHAALVACPEAER